MYQKIRKQKGQALVYIALMMASVIFVGAYS